MSHKAGHIIVKALLTVPSLTPEQKAHLEDIEIRDTYTVADRIYICALTYQFADDPVD